MSPFCLHGDIRGFESEIILLSCRAPIGFDLTLY